MHLCSPQKHTHRHGHTHTHTPYIHTYTSKATETFFYQTSSCVAHRAVKLHYCWSSVCSVNFPLIGLKSVGVRRHLKTAWSEREKQNGERGSRRKQLLSVCVCVCVFCCVFVNEMLRPGADLSFTFQSFADPSHWTLELICHTGCLAFSAITEARSRWTQPGHLHFTRYTDICWFLNNKHPRLSHTPAAPSSHTLHLYAHIPESGYISQNSIRAWS